MSNNSNESNGRRSILMLRFGSSDEDYQYEFFGSSASLYDKYSSEHLGITIGALNNYFSKNKTDDGGNIVYKNSRCLIIKSSIYAKSDNRGRRNSV